MHYQDRSTLYQIVFSGCSESFLHSLTNMGICNTLGGLTPSEAFHSLAYIQHFEEHFNSKLPSNVEKPKEFPSEIKTSLILDHRQEDVFGASGGSFRLVQSKVRCIDLIQFLILGLALMSLVSILRSSVAEFNFLVGKMFPSPPPHS